jgi:hypothetical protein
MTTYQPNADLAPCAWSNLLIRPALGQRPHRRPFLDLGNQKTGKNPSDNQPKDRLPYAYIRVNIGGNEYTLDPEV